MTTVLLSGNSAALSPLTPPPRVGSRRAAVGALLMAEGRAPGLSDMYEAWSTNLEDTMGGISAVRQCLRETKKVLPLLKQISTRDFFSYYAVNLITPCMYFPTSESACELDRCEIEPVWERDVPPQLLQRDLSEYGFTIDGWCRKDMPSEFTEYFDLRVCQSRNTGYDGSRVWRFIHAKVRRRVH